MAQTLVLRMRVSSTDQHLSLWRSQQRAKRVVAIRAGFFGDGNGLATQ
jgi:hypothetical protein